MEITAKSFRLLLFDRSLSVIEIQAFLTQRRGIRFMDRNPLEFEQWQSSGHQARGRWKMNASLVGIRYSAIMCSK